MVSMSHSITHARAAGVENSMFAAGCADVPLFPHFEYALCLQPLNCYALDYPVNLPQNRVRERAREHFF